MIISLDNKIAFLIILLLGITLITFLSREPNAFGQFSNQAIEIFDCNVQGNSTYEISGSCPDSDSDSDSDSETGTLENSNSGMEKIQGSVTKSPIMTDTLLPDISGLGDPFSSSK